MFKTIKGKLIFVVIFSVICIIITSILVMYKRIDIKVIFNIDAKTNI